MKRIQSSAIFQTLIFSQKPENGYTRDEACRMNRAEVDHYIEKLEKTRTRYKITDRQEQADGSILLRIRKQYNDRIDAKEYFEL